MYITLSQLQQKIKQTIELNVKAQWVLCDISDIKVNGAGHCYLELVEKSDGRGAIPKAKATAIIWKNSYTLIRNFFVQKTGIDLSAGLKVMLLVEVNYHELYGLSLVVRDIDPTYSLGDIERTRRETIAKLQADGIIEMNKELELPLVVERLAVVSSATAAGYDDFVNHLRTNPHGYGFEITLFEAIVQGESAEQSILSALTRISEKVDSFDAVILIRGGGSQSDLSCFNNYLLCSYIAQFPLPIITGIGHNKDQSVADIVAHTSLKTPTAVANFLIDTKRTVEELLNTLHDQLMESLSGYLIANRNRLEGLSSRLRLSTMERTSRERIRLERLHSSLKSTGRNLILDKATRCDTFLMRLKSFSGNAITGENHKLELFESKITSYDPIHILKQGYSMAIVNNKIVKSVSDVSKGDQLTIRVTDGEIHSEVK